MPLPVLAENRILRFAVFTSYYMMQGLPIGVFAIALPAWFTMQGVDKSLIASFVGIAGLPWALKLIAGPIIDRFTFRAMGLRRPWIIGTQTLMLLTAPLLLFVTDIDSQFWMLTGIFTVLNALAATEDVAVDGLAIAILPEEERGRANAFMAGGQILGISATGAASTALLNHGGLPSVGLFLIVTITLLLVISSLIRERSGERFLPWSKGEAHPDSKLYDGTALTRTKDLFKSLLLPMSLVMISIAFVSRMADGFIEIWGPELSIKHLGYSDLNYANWTSISLMLSAFIGFGFGPIVDKISPLRAFRFSLLLNAVLYFGYYFMVSTLTNPALAVTCLFLTQLANTLIFISSIALFMSLCRIRISTTQFACYMAIFNLGKSFGAFAYPRVSDFTGLIGVFWAIAAIFLLSWIISLFFDLETHKRHLSASE